MVEMTEKQLVMKKKLVGIFEAMYRKSFEDFLRNIVYRESPENVVMAEAFGINREEMALKCIKMVLDKRKETLASKPDPNQKQLFEF